MAHARGLYGFVDDASKALAQVIEINCREQREREGFDAARGVLAAAIFGRGDMASLGDGLAAVALGLVIAAGLLLASGARERTDEHTQRTVQRDLRRVVAAHAMHPTARRSGRGAQEHVRV